MHVLYSMCVGRPAGCFTTARCWLSIGLGRDEYYRRQRMRENKGNMQHATSNWRKRDKRYLMNNDHFIRPSFCSGKIFFFFRFCCDGGGGGCCYSYLLVWTYGRGEKENVLCGNERTHGRAEIVCVYFVKNY